MREIKIEEQIWTIDNLDITTYRNGDLIPKIEDADEWKNLNAKRLLDINPSSAFPLMRWMSGKPDNLQACSVIDELFFKIPPSMVISLLSASCVGGFLKYPKATKTESVEEDELIKKYL